MTSKKSQGPYILDNGNLDPFESVKIITKETSEADKIVDQNPKVEETTPAVTEVATDIDVFARKPKAVEESITEKVEEETKNQPDETVEAAVEEGVETNQKQEEQEQVSEETSADGTAEQPTTEDDSEVNLYYYMAQQLKKDGELPEDFEFDENIKPLDIYSTYLENIKQDAEVDIRKEVYNKLAQEGVNEADLQYAKLIRSGVDINSLSQASYYERNANVDIESADTSSKSNLIKNMYQDKGTDSEAIEIIVANAEIDDKLDHFAEKAKEYFGTKYNELVEREQNAAKLRDETNEQITKDRIKKVDSLLKSGKILDENIEDVKDFKKAMYERNVTQEVDGNMYALSELEKFIYDFDNDPEIKLWAFKKFKYRNTDSEKAKQEAKAEVEKEFFEGYKQAVEKPSRKSVSNQAIKKEAEKKAKQGLTIFQNGRFKEI